MTLKILARKLALSVPVVVIALACTQSLHAAACSNASLQGNYGFLVTGTASGNPIAISGQLSADGGGNISGLETISNNGAVKNLVSVTGTYNIGSSCAGTAAITPHGAPAANYTLVLAAGKVQIVGADIGTVESGLALPQGTNTCPASTVKGEYGLEENGALIGQGPVAFGGQWTLQSGGPITGTRSGSINGTISSGDVVGGVYKIDPSRCFGAAVIAINHGSPTHFNLVVVNGGHQIIFIQIDHNTVLSGSLER
jgi:hypothetical protein